MARHFLRSIFVSGLIGICLSGVMEAQQDTAMPIASAGAVTSASPATNADQPAKSVPDTTTGDPSQAPQPASTDDDTATCSTAPDKVGRCRGGPWVRTIVGFEQAGVSAAQSQQDSSSISITIAPLACMKILISAQLFARGATCGSAAYRNKSVQTSPPSPQLSSTKLDNLR